MINEPTEIFSERKKPGEILPDPRVFLKYQAESELKELIQQRQASGGTVPVDSFVSPLSERFPITQKFGNYNPKLYAGRTAGSKHLGVDVATPSGTPVRAPVSGKVEVQYDPRGFGTYVRVTDKDGLTYQFSHLSGVGVRSGAEVQAGQTIGTTGGVPGTAGAGHTTGAHLDISLLKGGQYIDPFTIEALRRALS